MTYSSIKHNDEFREKIKSMGYDTTELGLASLIKDKLKEITLGQLCRDLNISRGTIIHHMKKYGIKNPNKSGGANNPYGIKGKEGMHIDRYLGMK